ncbi:hypothetical protein H4219_006308 [Mycoemilia scoparia]|uniref:Uncharacterized protein n=1 Tax=Mycoemilia scoparia TaxID=417184 RepID=A0A9W8DM58_9FUNG|nr:hypothetical protein H4219_006308 [Mycoemilia scoparia]
MTFASFVNRTQTKVAKTYLPASIKQVIIVLIEVVYNLFHTFDKSIPNTRSRVNHYIQSAIRAHNDSGSSEKKVAIVTGAYRGIGYEHTKSLATAGYKVIMACRDRKVAEEAIAKLKRQTGLEGDDSFEFMPLDLGSFASINNFVEEYKKKNLPINLFVANAGIMMLPKFTETTDGVECQFGINHLGHFYVINSLLDIIKKSAPARIVIVSSIAQFGAEKIDYEAILDKTKYSSDYNYSVSKLANVTFANSLARKLKGTDVVVNSLHPGAVHTSLTRYLPFKSVVDFVLRLLFISPFEGSSNQTFVALDPEQTQSGKFYSHEVLICILMMLAWMLTNRISFGNFRKNSFLTLIASSSSRSSDFVICIS